MTLDVRFTSKTRLSVGGCVNWIATKNQDGYGRFRVNGRLVSAHRHAYEATFGPIPDGAIVRHDCDNPACVNPAHLTAGTYEDNEADKKARGRASAQTNTAPNKLTAEKADEIRKTLAEGGSVRSTARNFGVSQKLVQLISRGAIWCKK